MKIAVTKIGANITQSRSIKTASNMDIFSLTDVLIEQGHNVVITSGKTRNTVIEPKYGFINIMDYLQQEEEDWADILIVFNGAVNFFGGNESPELIEIYKLIVQYQRRGKPVRYVMTDCRFPLKQVWPALMRKEWGKKYYHEDVWVDEPVDYIYQGTNTSKLEHLLARTRDSVPCDRVFHVDIPWAMMLREPTVFTKPYHDREFHLMYGGANRDSYRTKRIAQLYDQSGEFDVAFFGSIKPPVVIRKKFATVEHERFIRFMSNSKATIIVGDQFMAQNWIALRAYESICAGMITFIDLQQDPERSFYSTITNGEMMGMLYVNSQREVAERLRILEGLSDENINAIRKFQWQTICQRHQREHFEITIEEAFT